MTTDYSGRPVQEPKKESKGFPYITAMYILVAVYFLTGIGTSVYQLYQMRTQLKHEQQLFILSQKNLELRSIAEKEAAKYYKEANRD
jgi:hypothetical protein